ncbi:hypothetical protein ACRYCC_26375 [Actinomadura scrupuli]|uniref:hypothetical protein n=1 Tax=Actinomadura scrupuli TaxID=559629 RepID=UPI003D961A66
MQLWCPFAEKRPLGAQSEPSIGKPRIFVIHTMSGYLRGTDSMFRQSGYGGTESHFGVGGQYDPAGLDGAIWQWQDLTHSADAQFSGNAYATSVETSDGARNGVRWSPKQAEAIVRLGVWWCQQTGHPARIVSSPSQAGFGWHAQFPSWNKNGHDCPGAVRLRQYKTEIVPEIARRLAKPAPAPKPQSQEDPDMPYGQLADGPGAITPIALPKGRFKTIGFTADNGLQSLPPAALRVAVYHGGGAWKVDHVMVDSTKGQTVVTFTDPADTSGISVRREDAGDVHVAFEVS